ncbi:IclR family transcriptional regulator [Maritimibacter sp. UBA3975]|uniref:IclR family transcriptional regulator n=1 Tax=Maritimibacter sp. UBA3975 TaxID=1946833 RepID=UPI000C0B4D1D|nr:IclR family transcriptional regulator [Maritimibacter sp. UBA3975]MAM63193.1 IclR family transcriptional regulator [Maritimibacter sp.]|tara:strand:- start:11362 stop:12153 length:792 start_codon:yes stop_codon:yes gene_type:complete
MDKTQTAVNDDRYLVPGLMRGMQVLGAFTPERRDMSLSDIARVIGQSRSATFRTVYTLTHMGYLLHDERLKTYSLGPAVMKLGHGYMANRELVEIAMPELERLRDETDWSAHLGVRDGARVVYVLRVPSRMGMGSIVHVGSRLPAASTTMGRVLLAALDEATITRLHRDGPPAVSGGSFLALPDILAQRVRDRETENVVQVGSFEAGISSVAAPVRDLTGDVIAAINATRAVDGLTDVPEAVQRAVVDTAHRLSHLLGYTART